MTHNNTEKEYLEIAVEEAIKSAKNNGGPFGAVLVYQDKIIARNHNTVTQDHDPTAHAEINVIREASLHLKTHNLSGTVLFCSCEPCPMCMAAAYWAHVDRIVFAATREDAAKAGFLDREIFEELSKIPEKRKIGHKRLFLDNMLEPFQAWQNNQRKIKY